MKRQVTRGKKPLRVYGVHGNNGYKCVIVKEENGRYVGHREDPNLGVALEEISSWLNSVGSQKLCSSDEARKHGAILDKWVQKKSFAFWRKGHVVLVVGSPDWKFIGMIEETLEPILLIEDGGFMVLNKHKITKVSPSSLKVVTALSEKERATSYIGVGDTLGDAIAGVSKIIC